MSDTKQAGEKRKKECLVVGEMIRLYCRKNHGTKELCPQCRELFEYAEARVRNCPFMETKTFCSNCRVHCYQPQMRKKIKEVMRFSGPRMLFHHPGMAIWHVVCSIRERNDAERKKQKK